MSDQANVAFVQQYTTNVELLLQQMGSRLRKAVNTVYGEDIEDMRVMEEEIANYQAHPESAISLDELRRRKKVNV